MRLNKLENKFLLMWDQYILPSIIVQISISNSAIVYGYLSLRLITVPYNSFKRLVSPAQIFTTFSWNPFRARLSLFPTSAFYYQRSQFLYDLFLLLPT